MNTAAANANLDARAPPDVGSLLDTSADCVKALSLDGGLLGMNPEGICLMEIEDFPAMRGMPWWSLWPAHHHDMLKAAVARAGAGAVARFSADCPTAKGVLKHWDVVVTPVHDETGVLASLLAISRDVTREVHLAGERALVARELAHRIANLFAVVDGVIALSARTDPAAREFAQAVRARVAGLGRAVSFIYDAGDARASHDDPSFHGLLHDLLAPYRDHEPISNIAVSGDDHGVSPASVTPLALIFNELATNAVKHGALGVPRGSVTIETLLGADAFAIRWQEHGAGAVSPPERSGYGTTLLDRTVGLQLAATITRDWTPHGLAVEIVIPLAQL